MPCRELLQRAREQTLFGETDNSMTKSLLWEEGKWG